MAVALAVAFDVYPVYAATMAVPKSDKKRRLSERSEFPPLPDFGAGGVGTPRSGAADWVAFSWFRSFGEAKE